MRSTEIWYAPVHCPKLHTVYLLDCALRLKEGNAISKDAVRFYGNSCIYVQISPDPAADELGI